MPWGTLPRPPWPRHLGACSHFDSAQGGQGGFKHFLRAEMALPRLPILHTGFINTGKARRNKAGNIGWSMALLIRLAEPLGSRRWATARALQQQAEGFRLCEKEGSCLIVAPPRGQVYGHGAPDAQVILRTLKGSRPRALRQPQFDNSPQLWASSPAGGTVRA